MLVLATLVVVLVVAGGVALATADCRWDSATGWNCYCGPGVPCDTTNKQEIIYGSPVGDTINAYGGDDTLYGDATATILSLAAKAANLSMAARTMTGATAAMAMTMPLKALLGATNGFELRANGNDRAVGRN
jgi:hypothetical protein